MTTMQEQLAAAEDPAKAEAFVESLYGAREDFVMEIVSRLGLAAFSEWGICELAKEQIRADFRAQ